MCSVNILSAFVISHLVPLLGSGSAWRASFHTHAGESLPERGLGLEPEASRFLPGTGRNGACWSIREPESRDCVLVSGLGPPLPAAALSTGNGKAQGCGQHTEASRTRQPFCSKFSVLPSSSSRPIKPSLIHSWSANEQEQSQLRPSRSAVQAWGRKSVYIV